MADHVLMMWSPFTHTALIHVLKHKDLTLGQVVTLEASNTRSNVVKCV